MGEGVDEWSGEGVGKEWVRVEWMRGWVSG